MTAAAPGWGETRHWIAPVDSLRTDTALAAAWSDLSRARIQKLIRDRHITVDGRCARAASPLHKGAAVCATLPPVEPAGIVAEPIDLNVLYEDDALLVVNKAPGMIVHPGAAHASGTLVNALLHRCHDLSGIGGVQRPGIVHRLDRETSGCLAVAKTDAAHHALSAQFAQRTAIKLYLALTRGIPRWTRCTADFPIARHPVQRKKMAAAGPGRGRAARTDFHLLTAGPELSLVLCRLHTGRTHQIRVHLHTLHLPIAGDVVYGNCRLPGCPRVMLHAWRLQISHPATGKSLTFTAPPPRDFVECFDGTFPSPSELDLAASAAVQ